MQQNLAPVVIEIPYSARMLNIPEWVLAARKHANMTQGDLSEKLGLTRGNISSWEKGRHEPGYRQLVKVSELTGYPLPQMPQKAGVTPRGAITSELDFARPIYAWEYEGDLPAGEFVMVPRLNVRLSAGHGRDQVEIELEKSSPQAFRADWIRSMGLKPSALAAMTASGESMEPTIFDSDSLLMDTSQNEISDGKVYGLWYDGGERVKRLFRLPGGGLRIQSDNARFSPIEVQGDYTDTIRVLGRIVHRSGQGGL
ncbi:MAG: S24 family peptidase [Pseudomonadota bacterium]